MQILEPQFIKQFILAGDAYFTVKNNVTGKFMHFHVVISKNRRRYFVEVKKGSVVETEGGEKDGNWVYMGEILDGALVLTFKSRVEGNSTEFKAFNWLLRKIQENKWQDGVVVYRHAFCGRCSHHLMDEISVADGLGAHCFKKVYGMTRAQYKRLQAQKASGITA